jgi:long-chain fatty acid transport protein
MNASLLPRVLLAAISIAAADAHAGGFALREQSAAGLGSSFAGVAAGGALSSMFWNPAAWLAVSALWLWPALNCCVPRPARRRR